MKQERHPMDRDLEAFLIRSRLFQTGAPIRVTTLSGGVSCDVWRVDLDDRTICVKRALPQLRVAANWEAPMSRNGHEWAWLTCAARHLPHAVPELLAHDPELGMFAMEFLDPSRFPVWKGLLLAGVIDASFAGHVARDLAILHRATAADETIASAFRTREAFYALRIDPYLLEAARRNPSVAAPLQTLAKETLATEIALVHGDVSPKNILVGAGGPVFLDAETAWFGDPAFDLAFCLNHLLLKCMARPVHTDAYLGCFAAFGSVYLASVSWENAAGLEARAARLLPALLLARVDGKSPVEYLTESDRRLARRTACRLLHDTPLRLGEMADAWRAALTLQLPHSYP
jgi:aminoglycoside phosphotransferase (APT) family kinase protein